MEGYFVFVVTVIVFITFQFCILIMYTSECVNSVYTGENSAKDWGTKMEIFCVTFTCCSGAFD